MANYTSQLLRRQPPQQALNVQGIAMVLQSKDQKWNANEARIDEALDQIGSIDLIRPEDKQHVLDNVHEMLGSISNVGELDLSSSSVAKGLESAIAGSIDDYTIDQVGNTRKIRKFGTDIQTIQQKNPELYNDANYAYTLDRAGFNQYMSGESNTLGDMTYTPYTDVEGKVQKGIKDLREYNKESEIDIPVNDNGVHRILTKKVKDLNEVELRGYVMSQLGGQERKQLQINGWADFRGATDEEVTNILKTNFENKTKSIDSKISLLNANLNNVPEWKKSDIQNRINILNQEKSYIENNLSTEGMSRDNLERMYKEQELVDKVTAANLDVDTQYSMGKTDAAYYDSEKLKVQQVLAQAKLDKLGPNTQQDAMATGQIGVIAAGAVQGEEIDPMQIITNEVKDQTSKLDSAYNSFIKTQIENLPSNDPNKAAWEKYKIEHVGLGKSERELFQQFSQESGFDPSYEAPDGSTRLFSQDTNEAADAFAGLSNIYKTTVNETFDTNIDSVYREAKSIGALNNNKFPVLDENGNATTMDKLLQNVSLEDFKENKGGIRDIVRKNLYKNQGFTELFKGRGRETSFQANITEADIDNVNKWLDLADDNKKFSDYFNITDIQGNIIDKKVAVESGRAVTLTPKNEEARKWMLNSVNTSPFVDTTVEGDSGLSNVINMNSNQFKDKIEENFYTYRQNALYVRPNLSAKDGGNSLNDVFQKVANLITVSSATTGVPIAISQKKPFVIQEDPLSPDYVIVSQPYEQRAGGETSTQLKVGKVLKLDLEDALGFKLNTNKGSEYINNIPIDNSSIDYTDDSTTRGKDMNNAIVDMVLKGEMPIKDLNNVYLTSKDINTSLDRNINSYEEDGQTRTQGYQLAKQVVSSPKNIGVKYVPKGSRGTLILYNKNTNEEINVVRVNDPQRIKEYRKEVRYLPQQFLGTSLQQMVDEQKTGSTELYNKFLKAIQ